MCIEVSLNKTDLEIEDFFDAYFRVMCEYEPYSYRAALGFPNLYIIPQHDPDGIWPAHWGFIPANESDNILSFRQQYNLHAISIDQFLNLKYNKPSLNFGRCLILADGFYLSELRSGNKNRKIWKVTNGDWAKGKLFAFAGIYSLIDEDLFSCCIITNPANKNVIPLEREIPFILDDTFRNEWLREDLTQAALKSLLQFGFTKDRLKVTSYKGTAMYREEIHSYKKVVATHLNRNI
ncbi:MAG: hypothetical protein CL524_07405 [Aequorivita sp.]|nr:hypothetical protein [Aequorivita sp.]MBF30539.1 hypothetical protein [Aequorivita sp.]|tara:strand:- start:56258 stop:56965 length:708 start_codon:yes stop_codon:yes gene_type:complete